MKLDLVKAYPQGLQCRNDVLIEMKVDSVVFLKDRKSILLKVKNSSELEFLMQLRTGLSSESLQLLKKESREASFLGILDKLGFLKPLLKLPATEATEKQLEWLSHFSPVPERSLKNFEDSRVLLIGCGGTGSLIAEQLVRTGLKHLTLVDPGILNRSDLNRQMSYFEDDIGKAKTELLKNYLLRINKNTSVSSHQTLIDSKLSLARIFDAHPADLIINCADTPIGKIHSWVAEVSAVKQCAALFGGVGLEQGTLGPLLTSPKEKLAYSERCLKAADRLDSSNIPKSTICFTNALLSTRLAFEAFKYLSGSMPTGIGKDPIELQLVDFERGV